MLADCTCDLQINRLYFIQLISPVGVSMWPGNHHPGLGCEFGDQVSKETLKLLILVIPAEAGIQKHYEHQPLDSGSPLRFARNDGLRNLLVLYRMVDYGVQCKIVFKEHGVTLIFPT